MGTQWRHKFLSKPWSRNYAVYVLEFVAFRSSLQLAKETFVSVRPRKESVIEGSRHYGYTRIDPRVARRIVVNK
jgi:hypothetical protein